MQNRVVEFSGVNLLDSIKTVFPLAYAYLMHSDIQMVRALEASDLKDSIKHGFSTGSSTVNLFFVGMSLLETLLMAVTVNTQSHLSNKEKFTAIALSVVAFAALGYVFNRFGIEQNTFAAGVAATVGTSAALGAKNLMRFFGERNKDQIFTLARTSSREDLEADFNVLPEEDRNPLPRQDRNKLG